MKFSELTKPELEEIIINTNFTEDESEIFKLLASNKSIEEIGQKLLLSTATISSRIKSIKNKIERSKTMVKTIPVWEKVALTAEEASEYSNIGVNRIRELMNEPGCTFVFYVGNGKKLIKRKEFERFIDKSNGI